MSSRIGEPLIYTERTDDEEHEPTQAEIKEYAQRIGINVIAEPELLYLAREGLKAKLPSSWKPCRQQKAGKDLWFYFNTKTQVSQWEHPMDPVYRDRVIQARSELALNRIQSFDPLTMRPPKSLPPLKRAGATLAPINPATASLGKIGGFGSTAESRQGASNSAPSNNNFHNPLNNTPAVNRVQSSGSTKTGLPSSSVNSFKDTDDDEEDSIRIMRPQRKSGLTLTGGGANFIKGPEGTKAKSVFATATSLDQSEDTHDSEVGPAGDSDKRPIKSILVNSISRPRPTDNVYELDGFSMNPDDMTDEEKGVFSQLESTTSRSKGNVKFNLDENTELKFEMSGDENEENTPPQNLKKNDDDTEDDLENHTNILTRNSGTDRYDQPPQMKERGSFFNNAPPVSPEYSEEDIDAMKKTMKDEMEAELSKFKEKLEKERKSRQEQIQKHLEETVAQYKIEKEETIKRIKKDMESEKSVEVDKAKREIDGILQKELEEMRAKFNKTLQGKQKELEEEHEKKMETLTEEFRKTEEERISVALKQQTSEEVLKAADQELKRQKESLREDHRRQLNQMKDYHKTILDRLQAELLAEEEKLRQDHLLKQAEMVAKFEHETDELKKKLARTQSDALDQMQGEFESRKSALEESLAASLQEVRDRLYQSKRSASETNLSDKAAEDELRSMKDKYQQLENKYKAMQIELQQLTQEMSARRRSSAGNSVMEQKLSGRSTRSLQKGNNNKAIHMRDSVDVSDTNQDSAHGSDSNTDSNSSLYPSSEVVAHQPGSIKVHPSTDKQDSLSPSPDKRIDAALQALEILKQEILDLKEANRNKQIQNGTPSRGIEFTRQIHNKISLSPGNKPTSSPQEPTSARKKTPLNPGKSARVKVSYPSPPTNDTSADIAYPPNLVSRSVSVVPQDLIGQHNESPTEDTHQRIVEDAKAFIRMQKNRLKDPSPIPNSSHLILPTTKNNLLLFDEKLLKSVSPRRPASIHLDLVSETESSGVSSLKDHRSSESKKLSKDIDDICNSLIGLDQQMKLMWAVVKEKQQQQPYYYPEESVYLNVNSNNDLTALIPNAMPILLGKSARVCASLPSSARKPFVPSTTMMTATGAIPSGSVPFSSRNYSSLLSSSPNSSSQTVIDALRMSGLSTTRLDCTDLLKSLEEELKDFRSTKQRLLDIQETFSGDDKRTSSPRHKNNNNNNSSNILAKTKDLQEWIKKY